MADMEEVFVKLNTIIKEQQAVIHSIAEKLERLESIGGGGTASIEDYMSGKKYKRNVLVVDTATETVYRVLDEYVSETVEKDCELGKLKLVGFESQIVSISHDPTQADIDTFPDDAVVAVYSTTDAPYVPEDSGYDI